MFSVGITGGIGSGKTYVCKIFEMLGIPIYYADSRTKALYFADEDLVDSLCKLLGLEIVGPQGLDLKQMSAIIFKNPEILKKVNALVHPRVWKDFDKWRAEQSSAFVMMESALLLETEPPYIFDRIIVVTAPKELRIKRVCKRDNVDRAAVEERMSRQVEDDFRLERADFRIQTDENMPLLPQITDIYNQLIQ